MFLLRANSVLKYVKSTVLPNLKNLPLRLFSKNLNNHVDLDCTNYPS